MLERYPLVELKVIEQNGQKLFYCAEEDFSTNIIMANMFGRGGCLLKVIVEDKTVAMYAFDFLDRDSEFKFFVQQGVRDMRMDNINADEFAVGANLHFFSSLNERERYSFSRNVKYFYLLDGCRYIPVFKGKEILHDELLEHYEQGEECEISWRCYVFDKKVDSVQKMFISFRKNGKTGEDFFDKAQIVIFDFENKIYGGMI